jgi:UDP-N-acetylmuramate dehydrogenase
MIAHEIQEGVLLAPHTTLGIGGKAEHFVAVTNDVELRGALRWARERSERVTVLGGGSNVLVSDVGVQGLVIRIECGGVTYEEVGEEQVRVTVGAGVALDALVDELVTRGVWGLENLSAIPGTVGATPIQNVGAYGVEVKDVIESVEVFDRETDALRTLTNAECAFGYRDSIFKHGGAERYIVLHVTFMLSRTPRPNIGYKDLIARFGENAQPTLRDIRDALIAIRTDKFPNWNVLGTAGSFFKNPVMSGSAYAELQARYPDMPGFAQSDGAVKVPLGWILDHVLMKKGYREGNVGLYEKQALVLVNYGGATCDEVVQFSDSIIRAVKKTTGIDVEREVRLLK